MVIKQPEKTTLLKSRLWKANDILDKAKQLYRDAANEAKKTKVTNSAINNTPSVRAAKINMDKAKKNVNNEEKRAYSYYENFKNTPKKEKIDTSKLVAEVDAFPDWLLSETTTKKWYELNNLASDASPVINWWEYLIDEENDYRNGIMNKFNSFLNWRSALRKWIRDGSVSVLWTDDKWNNRDLEEARKSSFVDYVRNAYVNSNDLSVGDDINKTKEQRIEKLNRIENADDYLLNYMINWNPDYQAAYEDYKKNWWFPNNLYEYMMWRSTSPYIQHTPEKEKWWFENFMSSWGATVPMEIWWAVSMVDEKTWISEANKKLNQKTWDTALKNISTEDYERYKNEWYSPIEYSWEQVPFSIEWIKKAFSDEWYVESKSRQDASQLRKLLYDQYDKYKYNPETNPDGFRGSVEQYAQYQQKVAEDTYKTFWEAITDYAKETFTEWTLSWDLWQMASTINQLIAWMWWKNAVFNSFNTYRSLQWLDQVPKLTSTALNLISMWLEWQALEDAYNKEVSDAWDYAKSVARTVAWEWIIRWWLWILKYIARNLWGLDETIIRSLWNINKDEWKSMTELTKKSKDPNSYETVFREIWKKFKPIKEKLKADRLNAWKEKEAFEKFNLWEYDAENLVKFMNDNFAGLTDEAVMWWKTWTAETPKFNIWKTSKQADLEAISKYEIDKAYETSTQKLDDAKKYLDKAKYERSKAKTKKEIEIADENVRKAEEEYNNASERYEKAAKDAWIKTENVKKAEEEKYKNEPEEIREARARVAEEEAKEAEKAANLKEREWKYKLELENWEWLRNTTDKDALDAIKVLEDEWNTAFVTNWQTPNAANILDVIKYTKAALQWSEWWKNRVVRLLINWLDATEKDLLSKVPEWYAEVSQKRADKKFLNKVWDDYVWKMEWKWVEKAFEEVEVWWKVFNSNEWTMLRNLFRQIKTDYWLDINNYLLAWAANWEIYWNNTLLKALSTIYPSLPWVMEVWLNWIRSLLAKITAWNYLKWAEKVFKPWDAYATVIPNEYKEDISNIWWNIRNTIWNSLNR